MSGNSNGSGGGSGREIRARDLPDKIFGYQVQNLIGVGAGSRVFSVIDPSSGKQFALKHVIPKTASHVAHTSIRHTFTIHIKRSFFRKPVEACLLMELVDGRSLHSHPPDTLDGVLRVFVHVADALLALHGKGVVHCDLKPKNIMITRDGAVKLIDLGQACEIDTIKPRIQGTPDFISPEQVKCEPVTPRTDVFCFGATLYAVLTLKPLPTLFTVKKGQNSFLLDTKVQTPHEINKGVPENLSNFVMECCRTNPSKRPGDMADVLRRLETIRHGLRAGLEREATARLEAEKAESAKVAAAAEAAIAKAEKIEARESEAEAAVDPSEEIAGNK
jgi:serine/threonine protein kinase